MAESPLTLELITGWPGPAHGTGRVAVGARRRYLAFLWDDARQAGGTSGWWSGKGTRLFV